MGMDGFMGSEVEAAPLLCGKDLQHRWFYALEIKGFLGARVRVSCAALTWLIGWASFTYDVCWKGPDGRTALELNHGRSVQETSVSLWAAHNVASCVTETCFLERCDHGCFLGHAALRPALRPRAYRQC